ncbi:MAG TPA: GDP-mannose 4,6-dehydratase [Cyanobacteria bacterium UBA8530]|nr:GDP-mannose 4,6-dehydratase [Cyanobacteria bacterium UBA8530]
MRVLITGGAGFIGSHSAEVLRARGIELTVLDNLSTGHLDNLSSLGGRFRFLEGDVRDPEALNSAMEGCQAVLHLAALVSVPESIRSPLLAHAINATGTLNVLEAARAQGIKRVVLASSAAVYGENQNLPLGEGEAAQSLSPYAAQKYLGEVYASIYSHLQGMSPVCLRYFNVFGPRQDPASPYSGVLSLFIEALVQGKKATIFGDGGATRDFVYVEDVALANLLAILAPESSEPLIFNVGTGKRTSILQAFEAVREAAGVQATPAFAPPREGDIVHSCADIGRARASLGYHPRFSFSEGITRTVAWSQGGNA